MGDHRLRLVSTATTALSFRLGTHDTSLVDLLGRGVLILVDQVLRRCEFSFMGSYMGSSTNLIQVLLHQLGALIRDPRVHEAGERSATFL